MSLCGAVTFRVFRDVTLAPGIAPVSYAGMQWSALFAAVVSAYVILFVNQSDCADFEIRTDFQVFNVYLKLSLFSYTVFFGRFFLFDSDMIFVDVFMISTPSTPIISTISAMKWANWL